MLGRVEQVGRWWLRRQHGMGEAHQAQFHRCRLCRRLVPWRRIRTGGCRCGATTISPARLTWLEKARVLALPWTL